MRKRPPNIMAMNLWTTVISYFQESVQPQVRRVVLWGDNVGNLQFWRASIPGGRQVNEEGRAEKETEAGPPVVETKKLH